MKEQFLNVYKFFNGDNNKFVLLLRNGIYLCKYLNDWGKFSETLLPVTEDFCIVLNMEDITDADYAHAKTVCQTIEIQNLGEYHDLHIQSNTLLLADVFERFDLFPAPGLA